MRYIVSLLFIFSFYLNTTLSAVEKEVSLTEDIARLVASSVYETDTEQINIVIKSIVNQNKAIQAIKIKDFDDGEVLLKFYRDDKLLQFDKDIPEKILKIKSFVANIVYEDEIYGEIIVYFEDKNKLILTNKELLWIKKHPIITVGAELDWAPFDFVDDEGKYTGLAKDYFDVIEKQTGLKFKYDLGKNWSELMSSIKDGSIDILPALMETKERKEYINFTSSYLSYSEYFFTRADFENIENIKQLYGKTVAVIKGYQIIDWLMKNHPKINLIVKSNILECLKSVETKQSDCFIGDNPSTSHIIAKHMLSNIKINSIVEGRASVIIHMGAKKEYKILADIITKALKNITLKQKSEIASHWMSVVNKTDSKILTNLTNEEKNWIKTHTVKIGVEQWEPIVFSNNGTDIDGIFGDFTKVIIERTGLKVEIVNDEWDKILNDFKSKKIDILPATYYTEKRSKFGFYSSGYFAMKDYIYFKSSRSDLHSLEDFNGKTLALTKGHGAIDKIQEKFPNIKIVTTKDLDDSISRVLTGKVDALYNGQISVQKKINDDLITGLKSTYVKVFTAPKLHYISNIDEPLLKSIIQKGLDSITYSEKKNITSKWIGNDKAINLTQNEQIWLDKNKNINYVYDPDWKPLEWMDSTGKHQGIISDIIKLLEEKSDLNLIPIGSKTWSDAIDKVKNNKAVMFSGVGETIKRKEYLNFTDKVLFSTPYVFVSQLGQNYIDGFENLKNKKVLVLEESTIESLIMEKYPNLRLTSVLTLKDGFDEIQNGNGDIFVVAGTVAKYNINVLGYDNLQVSFKTNFKLNLKIAIRKDSPEELLSIINKSLDLISKKEIGDIVHKWTSVKITHKTDWVLISKIGAGVFLVLLFILWNNYNLKKIVKEKTKDLQNFAESLEDTVIERTKELTKSNRNIKDSIEYASLIQKAILPEKNILGNYTKDHFIFWQPRDTVGGDIYFITELDSKKEILLMVIDGAGHGVPGAFVTMLVKAIENQIIAEIKAKTLEPSPEVILEYFNRSIKTMLKQDKTSKSNAGFDGGVLYYNKETNKCTYAGAKTPLYIINNNELEVIQSDRKNVGFKRTKIDQQYTLHNIEIKDGTKLYIATDGMLDQEGKNETRYGKKEFERFIMKINNQTMEKQKENIIEVFETYKSGIEQSDDVTIVALKF